jgi:hypothetical protein
MSRSVHRHPASAVLPPHLSTYEIASSNTGSRFEAIGFSRSRQEIQDKFERDRKYIADTPFAEQHALDAYTRAIDTVNEDNFIGSPRIWSYIDANQVSSGDYQYFISNLGNFHKNNGTNNSAFILDNEYAFVFDSRNDNILEYREQTPDFNFKFYFKREDETKPDPKSILKRDDSIKMLRTAIRKNTYVHFTDYNGTITSISDNTDFIFPTLSNELQIPHGQKLQDFFDLIKEPINVDLDKTKMNLLIDGENIIKALHHNPGDEWSIGNTHIKLKDVILSDNSLNNIINFVNVIDKGTSLVRTPPPTYNINPKYNKYICTIPRYRLHDYYMANRPSGHDAANLITKLDPTNNDLIIIEKTIPDLNITIFFISLPFQKPAIEESARMNDYPYHISSRIPSSAKIAEEVGPNFQLHGTESDDLLLMYMFFRCGGNILSFDKFRWLKAGQIKYNSSIGIESRDFISDDNYFRDFYILSTDQRKINDFNTIEEDISKLQNLQRNGQLEISTTPLPSSANTELCKSIIYGDGVTRGLPSTSVAAPVLAVNTAEPPAKSRIVDLRALLTTPAASAPSVAPAPAPSVAPALSTSSVFSRLSGIPASASAPAASAPAPSSVFSRLGTRPSGGSKKRKTIKKITHKKRNKKVTQNKKKKLTRKMRK